MKQPKNKTTQRVQRLLAAFCDGYLGDDGREELESLLRRDSEARRTYLRYLDLHQELARRADLEQLFPGAPLIPQEWPVPPRPHWIAAAAAALVAVVGFLVFAVVSLSKSHREETSALSPVTKDTIAMVSRADRVVWEGPKIAPVEGAVLYAGDLRLVEGELRLEYFNGVAVTLRAPAQVELDSPEGLFLREGQLAAVVPADGPTFAVQTPDAVLYEMRAGFSLTTLPGQPTKIQVTTGELSAALLGEDGVPLHGQVLRAGTAITMEPETGEIQPCEVREGCFAGMLRSAPKALGISEAYVAAVRAGKPLAYWRFETLLNGKVPNEMGARHALVTYQDEFQLEGRQNKVAYLPPRKDALGGLRTEEPFTSWTSRGEYSVELWMNPINDKWSSLASLVKPEERPPVEREEGKNNRRRHHAHLMTLDCMPDKGGPRWMQHEPRAVRFYHRTCCRDSKDQGTGLFSKNHYTPGHWHHVVITCAKDQLTLYLNGRVERTEHIETRLEEHPYLLVLGRYSREDERFAKLFSGRLDEVAFYDRALSANEVLAHFSLVEP